MTMLLFLAAWGDPGTFATRQLADGFYAEGCAVGDFDRDGHADVVSGPFWYAGPDFREKHAFYPPQAFDIQSYSDAFLCFAHDLNGDGWDDVVVVGWPGKRARWYENPARPTDDLWAMHPMLEGVDHESPQLTDVDRDGRPDLVCIHDGAYGYASPGEDVARPWAFRAISDNQGWQRYTHGLGVGDIDGDGRADVLDKDGWWSQPADPGATPWPRTAFDFADGRKGGAQMLVADFTGDGRADVATSLDAHGYGLSVFERTGTADAIDFRERRLSDRLAADATTPVKFTQPHALAVGDVDGDGRPDIVTGKRYWAHGGNDPDARGPRVVYAFCPRGSGGGVAYEPILLSRTGGVGTQVTIADVTGDGRADVVVGNKAGVFVTTRDPAAEP